MCYEHTTNMMSSRGTEVLMNSMQPCQKGCLDNLQEHAEILGLVARSAIAMLHMSILM